MTQGNLSPFGTTGSHSRRLLFHHLPLTVASILALALFMRHPTFDAHAYAHPDLMSGAFPKLQTAAVGTGHDAAGLKHGADTPRRDGRHEAASNHQGAGSVTTDKHGGLSGRHGRASHGARRDHAEPTGHDRRSSAGGHGTVNDSPQSSRDESLSRSVQQFTVATGYIGLALLALTLLLGPANLVFRRRNPVSTYLRRDVGIWTGAFSLLHVIAAVFIHTSHGRGFVSSFLHFFITEDGAPLTNSFGWGNWTGLAATVIAAVLLVTSNDAALRALRAKRWKWLQRLNYALIALVVVHAFFYGAFLRMNSPFTWLLLVSATIVALGQGVGVWLWRRRAPPLAAT